MRGQYLLFMNPNSLSRDNSDTQITLEFIILSKVLCSCYCGRPSDLAEVDSILKECGRCLLTSTIISIASKTKVC